MELDVLKEIPLILFRLVTIIPVLLFVALFMGRRAIGEMPVFDFLVIVVLGAVVGADIADPSIHHLPTLVTIMAIGIMQRMTSRWIVSSRKFGRLITFEPTIVIWKGNILEKNLWQVRYSIDNLLVMLREQHIFDLADVELGVVEPNGRLSVQLIPEEKVATKKDVQAPFPLSAQISFPVIVEGKVYEDVLSDLGLDLQWLRKQLREEGIEHEKDVLFASVNEEQKLTLSSKKGTFVPAPPTFHH
ncbi:YetF domain-containing protein [Paludifilum halophilum]|uniref:DUF421 domain-containing protein n=1 Tax=Paludifilum halophilum TaxID=1642702 RepID=A0A235B2J0_9BACL|nr:DUF421 domain-containing protein [Paludifilum halophilum]OYD06493.1 DUF421 domain-containing protein [Paludifilum halophilum]